MERFISITLVALILGGCDGERFDSEGTFDHNLFTVNDKEFSIVTNQDMVPVNIDVSKANASDLLEFDVHSQPDNGRVTIVDRSNGIAVLNTEGKTGDFSFEIIATDGKKNKSVGRITISKNVPSKLSKNAFRKFTFQGIDASKVYSSDG